MRVTWITLRLWFMERKQVCSRSVYRTFAFQYVTNDKTYQPYILVFCVRIDPMPFFFSFNGSFVSWVYILFCLLKSGIQKSKRTQYDHRYCLCFLFDVQLLTISNMEPLLCFLILDRSLNDWFGKQKVIDTEKKMFRI